MSRQVEIFPWNTMQFVDEGTDSMVYRRDNMVLKRYSRSNPLSVVEKYMELTNIASQLLNDRPFTTCIVSHLDQRPLFYGRYQVEPIDWVKLDTSNRPVAASRYIPGPKALSAFLSVTQEGEMDWSRQVAELEQAEQGKLDEVRKALTGGRLEPGYPALGSHIVAQTRSEGIDILGLNVKIRYDVAADELTFVVTDLAANLCAIKRLWKKDYKDLFAYISCLFPNKINSDLPSQS